MQNNDTMTFTVTAFNKTITITQPEDINIHEFLDTCRSLAIAMEYHHDSWEDAILKMADDIKFAGGQDPVDTPPAAKGNFWVHTDGSVRDYPDLDSIPLKMSDC